MKQNYSIIIVVLAIVAAMTVAGCTSPGSNTTSPTAAAATASATATASAAATTPGQASVQVGTVTAAPSSSGLTTLGSAIDYSDLHWYEYQMTGTSAGVPTTADLREDLGVTYNGTKANEVTLTMNTAIAGTQTVTVVNSYSDAVSGNSLGGHMTMTSDGQAIMDQALPAGEASSASNASAQNPLIADNNAQMTSMGTVSVTVPAGTYTATEYSWTNSEGTGNVWVAPNVPVPVKITGNSQGTTMEMDLTGWG